MDIRFSDNDIGTHHSRRSGHDVVHCGTPAATSGSLVDSLDYDRALTGPAKPWECSLCGRKFKIPWFLVCHMWTWAGIEGVKSDNNGCEVTTMPRTSGIAAADDDNSKSTEPVINSSTETTTTDTSRHKDNARPTSKKGYCVCDMCGKRHEFE
ncbi:hypothetical protein QBC43DRAFT_334261 [Cladorrhinum sp. PSN259]|nr:hypothetical protein QBC43DRAFT_334261 [Cladorrhinum sp. PSN259]